MKVVSFKCLSNKKRKKKHIICCTKSLFKPLCFTMGVLILMFVTNLLVSNFFVNIKTSLQNFVDNFVIMF